MRILICGGRDFKDRDFLFQTLDGLHKRIGLISTVIQGGAPGADSMAKEWATKNHIFSETFYANWRKYGRSSGFLRNERMLAEGKPGLVIAFPTGGPGTKDMIHQANRAGIPVEIFQ